MFNIINKLHNSKWMLEKRTLYNLYDTLTALNNTRVGGLKGLIFGNPPLLKSQEVNPPVFNNPQEIEGDMAIISVSGILTKGATELETELLGLQNTDEISSALDEMSDDPAVSKIVMCFSSPGGETAGIEELGRKIRDIDENVKPVYIWTETHMASAAYWLGSQGSKIGMTPSAQVGSVGVYMLVLDATDKYRQEGIKVQAISSGKYKMLGHDFEPLKSEEKELLQQDVEDQHNKFKQVILEKRPDVKAEALEGLSYEGEDALELGLVDVVCDSLAEYLAEITN